MGGLDNVQMESDQGDVAKADRNLPPEVFVLRALERLHAPLARRLTS